jgi:hypothetical protein
VKVFSNFVLSLQLQDNILPARKGTGTGFWTSEKICHFSFSNKLVNESKHNYQSLLFFIFILFFVHIFIPAYP